MFIAVIYYVVFEYFSSAGIFSQVIFAPAGIVIWDFFVVVVLLFSWRSNIFYYIFSFDKKNCQRENDLRIEAFQLQCMACSIPNPICPMPCGTSYSLCLQELQTGSSVSSWLMIIGWTVLLLELTLVNLSNTTSVPITVSWAMSYCFDCSVELPTTWCYAGLAGVLCLSFLLFLSFFSSELGTSL